jgi:hypothetical protein
MKKISKLICLILSLIFLVACSGCLAYLGELISGPQLRVNELVASLELEIDGYDVVFSEEPLEFARIYGDSKKTYFVEYNGESYKCWEKGSGVAIQKQNEDLNSSIILITNVYMSEKNIAYSSILNRVREFNYFYLSPLGIIEFDGRLFVYCGGINRDALRYVKPLIFEFNPVEETVKYAGTMEEFDTWPSDYEENYKGTYLDVNSGDYYHYEEYSMPVLYMAKIIKTN